MSSRETQRRGETFVKLRTGLHAHFVQGSLTESEGYLFLRLLLAVTAEGFPATGVVWSSSADIAHRLIPTWSVKKAQRVLRSLQAKRYVRSWRHGGSRGTYPLQIDRWEVPFGETRGRVINAFESDSYKRPAFEGETQGETQGETRGETRERTRLGNPVLKNEIEIEREELTAASPPPSSDPPAEDLEAAAVVEAFDGVLSDEGLPPDTRTRGARARDLSSARRLIEQIGESFDLERFRAAARAGLRDHYLRSRGMPFGLFASQAPRFIRAATLEDSSSRISVADALGQVDQEFTE